MTRLRSIVSSLLLLSLPSFARAAAAPVRVNIGAASVSSSMLSLWAAQEQGLFAKHGIDAQLILIRGGSTLVASLVTGEIQLAFTSGVSVLGAAAQGVDVKMLTSISSRVSWKLIANPQIKTAAELRGKRFGVQSIVGSTWMYAMLALEQLGLEPKRDNISFLPIGDAVTIGHSLRSRPYRRRGARPAAQPAAHRQRIFSIGRSRQDEREFSWPRRRRDAQLSRSAADDA